MLDDREQLERLLSEQLDGTLDADERLVVERAREQDASAAASAERYRRLQELLAQWRPLTDDVDWPAMARFTSERVAEAADEAEYQRVDRLVEQWADSLPEVDWDRFKVRVASAVRQEAVSLGRAVLADAASAEHQGRSLRWTKRAKWMATVGVPLAAAAVIVVAVWWPGAVDRVTPGHGGQSQPLVFVALEAPRSVGKVLIDFDRSAGPGEDPVAEGADGTSMMPGAGGLAIAAGSADYAESADEALFY